MHDLPHTGMTRTCDTCQHSSKERGDRMRCFRFALSVPCSTQRSLPYGHCLDGKLWEEARHDAGDRS